MKIGAKYQLFALSIAFVSAITAVTMGVVMELTSISNHNIAKVDTISKRVRTPSDIEPITDSLVRPYVYLNAVSLHDLRSEIRKEKFVEMVLPAFLIAKHRLINKKRKAEQIHNALVHQRAISQKDSLFFVRLFATFKAESWPELERKLTPHPVSIAIGQTAIESGWGTSRFFSEANNFTGIWSYNRNEKRIEANKQRQGKSIHLRAYANLLEAAEDYYETIGRVHAYRSFRQARMQTTDPYQLASHLTSYSELGKEYTERLKSIIRYNQLTRYDAYQLHPDYMTKAPL